MSVSNKKEEIGNNVTAALVLKEEGNRLQASFKYALAAEKYTEAIELHPTAILLSNRAQSLIKLESYGLAIQDARRAISIDPTYIKAYYRRGSANYALGQLKEALKDFEAVAKIFPKDIDAQKKMKQCKKEIKAEAFNMAILSESVETAEPSLCHSEVDTIAVEASYDGPVLGGATAYKRLGSKINDKVIASNTPLSSGIVTMEFVHDMIEYFRKSKRLHRKFVCKILLLAKEHFENQPSLLRLTLPMVPGLCADNLDSESSLSDVQKKSCVGHFTVCGDTHGQFYDLLHIFQEGGFPSEQNPYLFNGDFVDRGSFSFETVFTLLTIKLACPMGLFMLRGNHETKNMNKIYGFEGEVNFKYDATVMKHFANVFNWLPLAAVISNRIGPSPLSVFVVHGGLSTNIPATDSDKRVGAVSLCSIEAIIRGREPPESGLMADLLWADPHPLQGRAFSKRGVGFSFGPDFTAAFLEKNNLQLLVRSHEVKDEGYELEHDGKCVTIFSAPNYCDQMGNKGAFIRFKEDMKPNFTQFTCSPHPDIPPMRYAGNMFGL